METLSPTMDTTSLEHPSVNDELINATDSGDNDRRLKVSVVALVSGAAALAAVMGGGLAFYYYKTGASIEPDF
jgi:hypothetical protein